MWVQRGVGKQLVGQRLQPSLAGNHALGAALGFVGQVNVFQFLLGWGGFDGGQQLGRELALLLDAFDDRNAAVFEFAQVAQAGFELAKLDVVQTIRHFFAVAGDEGNGGTAIEQLHSGFDLVRSDTDFSGQLGQDFRHGGGFLSRKRASLPQGLRAADEIYGACAGVVKLTNLQFFSNSIDKTTI